MSRPRAVVFDLDGTLLDSRLDIARAANRPLCAHGFPERSVDEIVGFVGDGARLLVSRALNFADADPRVDAVLQTFLDDYTAHAVVHSRLLPGAREALDALDGLPLALCTNKPRATTDVVLEALDLARHFRVVLAGGDTPEKKPDPAPLLAVAERLGLPPAALVMVGDGPQDVLAGRAAGCVTVAVVGPLVPRDCLAELSPNALLDGLDQLPALVERWRAQATS